MILLLLLFILEKRKKIKKKRCRQCTLPPVSIKKGKIKNFWGGGYIAYIGLHWPLLASRLYILY
jgi:hypothetical protein